MRRTTGAISLAVLLLACAPAPSPADEGSPSPPGSATAGDVVFEELARNMIEGTLTVMARPETAALLASYVRNFHQALVAEGFSEEQALEIVIGVGLPTIQ